MVIGAHLLLYSADPSADRAFLRDVLGFKYVDTGQDWLIFQLPPAEAGVHPLDGPNMPPAAAGGQGGSGASFMVATVWLLVEDIEVARQQLAAKGLDIPEAHNEGWGIATTMPLPSGARLGLY
ncbi:MAG: VOC family protein, partial [bacterium]|nr:VOC family protein [bacterium]